MEGHGKPMLRALRSMPSALETWEKYVDGDPHNYSKNTHASEEDRVELPAQISAAMPSVTAVHPKKS